MPYQGPAIERKTTNVTKISYNFGEFRTAFNSEVQILINRYVEIFCYKGFQVA